MPRDGREARLRQGRRALKSTYCPPTLNLAEPLNANHFSTQNPEPLGARSQHPDPVEKNGIAEEMNSRLGGAEKIADTERSLALYSRQLPHFVPEIEGAIIDTREVTRYEDVPASRIHNYTLGGNLFSLSDPVLDTDIKAVKFDSEGFSKQVVTNNWRDREFPRSISNPCIQPRPPALASTQLGRKTGRVPLGRSHSSLLELQDSFSKTEVHQRLHSTLQGATADLRLNTSTGRKHQFNGLNCYYFNN